MLFTFYAMWYWENIFVVPSLGNYLKHFCPINMCNISGFLQVQVKQKNFFKYFLLLSTDGRFHMCENTF